MRWPTGTDVTAIRSKSENRSRFYLGVQKGKELTSGPPPLMVGQHYALIAADAYDADEHTLTFNVANFLLNTDILPNMTLACGTLADPFLYGSARIREVDTANNRLCLEPNNLDAEGYWDTGDYIWVDGIYRLYRKLPFIVAGVVYEDGNPDTLLGAAGIPGRGIAFSANYYDRPIARMGSPRFAWTGEAINFYGWRSNGRGGNAINAYAWDFDGGAAGGAGAAAAGTPANPVTGTWNTAGEYVASLTVTDNSGKAGNDAYGVAFTDHVAVRPVLVFDRPGEGDDPPYTDFEVQSLGGKYGGGWSLKVTVYGTADKDEFPDNALVILFCEDWHGGTEGSRGGWYGQESILFVGHIRADSVSVDSEKSTVSFEAQTIEQWMKEIDCWPCNFESTAGAPTAWHEFQAMTVEDCLWYMAEFRSNLKDVTDCFFASDVNTQKALGFVDITEDSLYSQMSDQLGSCFFGEVSASRHGSIHLFKHKNMLDLTERAWWGPPIWSFALQDWLDELQIGEERQRDSVAQIDFIGFIYDANGNPLEVYSLAPERQTNFGVIEKVTGILLSGNTRAAAQAESNTLAGLYRAWRNIRFPHVRVPAVNNRFLEPATLDYFAVELDEGDTVRGYDWDGKEFLCTEVSYEIDQERGCVIVDITGEASTWGPDGVAGLYPSDPPSSEPPDEPPEYWAAWPSSDPPPWAEGLTGEGEVVYFVDRGTGRLFRTRNGRASTAADVVYEDLGLIGTGNWTYWIALDEFDPWNVAMACGANGIYKTTNLNDDIPTWTQVDANDFTMGQVVSSEAQEDLWMATSNVWSGGVADITVYWTTDAGATAFNSQLLANDASQGMLRPAWIEACDQDADRAWVVWQRNGDWVPRNARTDDQWASHSVVTGVTQVGHAPTNSYHRYTNNPPPPLAVLWGGDDETEYCTNEWALCTTGAVNTGGGNHRLYLIGGYKWRDDRYWALSVVSGGSPARFHTSDDAVNWTLRYSFPGTTRHVCSSRYSSDWFYAAQDGAVAPLLVSNDRGVTWQAQTGNWAALGYNITTICCAVN